MELYWRDFKGVLQHLRGEFAARYGFLNIVGY
jgi:hypothetical protein